jgi:CDP-diacylglycerol--glycerol-3-phosphate 3-phosphatidyltransferase
MIALVVMLYLGRPGLVLGCVPFLILIILMDTLDGNLARRRGETSLLGSALDIAADRTLELILWVVFANLGLISVAVPLIVIVRGVTVDAVRAVGISQGIPPFNQVSSPISRFLVSSKVMRSSYSVSKAFAFNVLIIDLALRELNHPWDGWVHIIALGLTWLAVLICVARGVPVLVSGAALLSRSDRTRSSVSNHQTVDREQ